MFLICISLFAMARKTRERKYTNLAKKSLASIKDWAEKGNPNVVHCKSLLEAELAALNGRQHAAKKHYEVAAMLAGRGGFVRDAALANERYGEFLIEDESDREEAAFRFQEASKLYLEWEARAKAGLLSEVSVVNTPQRDIDSVEIVGVPGCAYGRNIAYKLM
jgi:hypothetical protein